MDKENRLTIEKYLRREGAKPFQDPKSYWNWVRQSLGTNQTKQFSRVMEERSQGRLNESVGFYDFLAKPEATIAAASFEYGLLVQIAHWVESNLPNRGTVIELGSHSGLLTRYYALIRPEVQFIGIERSEVAVKEAQKIAQERRLDNVKFITADISNALPTNLPRADAIITGRVIGEMMSPLLRKRVSWRNYEYPQADATLDYVAKESIRNSQSLLSPGGQLLVTERVSSFDRLNRIWEALWENGFHPDPKSLTPISWQEVSENRQSWFFVCGQAAGKEYTPLDIQWVPFPHEEVDATNYPTRFMLNGILAYQTWKSLSEKRINREETLNWESGEELHLEIGKAGPDLGFTYIASNTDTHLLTLYLPQETDQVMQDLMDYLNKIRLSGAFKPANK
jgi:tRNA1(Val) A37 N6-methylase TrmN6